MPITRCTFRIKNETLECVRVIFSEERKRNLYRELDFDTNFAHYHDKTYSIGHTKS